MKLIDISPVVDDGIAVWPGDQSYARRVSLDLARGDNITLSSIATTVHVGAHADAPSHYAREGGDIASRALEYYIGPCIVMRVDVARGARVMPEQIAGRGISSPRVLFKTGTFPDPSAWNRDFASLSPELIDELYQHGVILVGIDTPSIDPFASKALEAHQAVARYDMAILEGLVLDAVDEGEYELIAAPLRLRGADASPVRAVLRTF